MYILLLSAFVLFAPAVALAILGKRWKTLALDEPRVILSGGGTGGHVNPALAIAEGIKNKEPNTRFLYLGVRGKAESVIVRRAGYPLWFVSSEGFPGIRPSFSFFRFLCRLAVGVLQSMGILLWFAPRWIIATGGYVSAPVIIAALLLRKLKISHAKIFLHEQNSIPGQLNAFLGKWVDRVLLTFPQTLSFFPRNGVIVGYPIRNSIVLKSKEEALQNLPVQIPEGRQVIFAFGGSGGARTINRAIVDALHYLIPHRDRLFIIHGMGLAKSGLYNAAADTESRIETALASEERVLLDEFYFKQDYFHNIADVYSISDLIVCRSGAGSLNEISSLGKPAILVPKANLPGDHQVMNARAMRHSGSAEILFEDTVVEEGELLEKLQGKLLAERILRLLSDADRLQEMAARSRQFLRRNANERILSELYEDESYNNGIGYQAVPFRPLVSNQRLLQLLSGAYNRSPAEYDPLAVVGDEDDLTFYRHRAAGLLSHIAWQDRNLGVKLIGYTKDSEKIPTLLHMLADRTKASWLHRCFGGDFAQVGFIRRNIVQALQIIGRLDNEVELHLLKALRDPYFEVRSQACKTIAHFGVLLAGKDDCLREIMERLKDESFEVIIEAVGALGEIGLDGRDMETLLDLKEHHYWQVRKAALNGIKRLLERRVVSPSPSLLSELSSFILTATDFRPHFSIKESYKDVQTCCHERLLNEKSKNVDVIMPDSISRKL